MIAFNIPGYLSPQKKFGEPGNLEQRNLFQTYLAYIYVSPPPPPAEVGREINSFCIDILPCFDVRLSIYWLFLMFVLVVVNHIVVEVNCWFYFLLQ